MDTSWLKPRTDNSLFILVSLLVNKTFKGALSDLRQFSTTESSLKMMKDAYFTAKALFVLKIFKFLS